MCALRRSLFGIDSADCIRFDLDTAVDSLRIGADGMRGVGESAGDIIVDAGPGDIEARLEDAM